MLKTPTSISFLLIKLTLFVFYQESHNLSLPHGKDIIDQLNLPKRILELNRVNYWKECETACSPVFHGSVQGTLPTSDSVILQKFRRACNFLGSRKPRASLIDRLATVPKVVVINFLGPIPTSDSFGAHHDLNFVFFQTFVRRQQRQLEFVNRRDRGFHYFIWGSDQRWKLWIRCQYGHILLQYSRAFR